MNYAIVVNFTIRGSKSKIAKYLDIIDMLENPDLSKVSKVSSRFILDVFFQTSQTF